MCLLVVLLHQNPAFPLIVIGNRDEFHARPTEKSHWWPEGWLAGKDLQAGGTWMGITPTGRFAAITNIRNMRYKKAPGEAPSRGELVTRFLQVGNTPQIPHHYEGFNLITASLVSHQWQLFYHHNHQDQPAASNPLPPGVYGLSNGSLNEPWPKTQRLKGFSDALLSAADYEGQLLPRALEALGHTDLADDEALPDTGVPIEWERMLSAIKIVSPAYGTRSSTVLAVSSKQKAYWTELGFGPDGCETHRVTECFSIDTDQAL